MNIKRSFFTLLMGSAGFGLFLANCTVSTSSSDKCSKGDKDTGCECPGKITGYQVCNSSGVFGDCQCPGTNTAGSSSNSSAGNTSNDAGAGNTSEAGTTSKGGTTSNGGTATTAGTDAGGVSSAEGGAGGAGGENGTGVTDFATCEDCLMALCPTQFDACLNDSNCFSTDGDGTGEYEAISTCIEGERASGVAKRDAVRGCGVTFGASADPDLVSAWAPHDMAATTTDLINCMATSQSKPVNADWANDQTTNFPNGVPAPWPNDSCAKLACTSMK